MEFCPFPQNQADILRFCVFLEPASDLILATNGWPRRA